MIQPFQQTEKKIIGKEYVAPGEEGIVTEMIEEMQAQLERLYTNTKTLRQVHTKMHGCVKATFTVLPDITPELQQGIFKTPATYPAWIRFSNANTKPQADGKKDIRGAAIKLMNVPGEKLIIGKREAQTQDFLLMSNETFFSKNIVEFRKMMKAATAKSKLKMVGYVLNPAHWPVLIRFKKSNTACTNPFSINYWSTQPYQYGSTGTAVKYMLQPHVNNKIIISDTKAENYLRTNMAATLAANEIRFDFCIQLQTDAETMPVENPTIAWQSPFVKVAEIKIPVQVFDEPEQMEFGDNLSFNIWHSLPEHRPLGSFNRARKRAYEELAKFRHERNHIPVFEPTATNRSFTVPTS